MPSLYRRSTVFVDIRNMVVSYDAIVASRLERYFSMNPAGRIFFIPELMKVCKLPVHELVFRLMAEKTNRNFLLDYFDWSKVELSPEDVDPMKICQKIYDETLLLNPVPGDVLENGDISPIMTSIGKSFQLLLKDSNLNTLYLYLGFRAPNEIQTGLSRVYNGDVKCSFLKGTALWLTKFLQRNICDSYFFEDCTDIDDMICRKHPVLSEVIVPGNPVNLSAVDELEGTRLRDISLEYPPSYYKDKFNLDIHSISLPI